jgi:small-conductance mechanosensitive channel
MSQLTQSLLRAWQAGSAPLFEISGTPLTLGSLLMIILILVVSYQASKLTTKWVSRLLENKPFDRGLKGATERISGYVVFLFGLLLALDLIGLNLRSIAAFSAILLIGLGFAFQSIIQNFIAGLILLIERPIKKGDMIRNNTTFGRVLDIGFRSTVVLTRDDIAIIIPNSELVTSQVINESLTGDKIRLSFTVRTKFNEDSQKIHDLLLSLLAHDSRILQDPRPTVFLNDFAEFALEFKLVFWSEELWKRETLLSDLRYKVHQEFIKQKIEIPVPQRVIQMKTQV